MATRQRKSTGITRAIDELGRVVIPKELRMAQHIAPGDLLEIYVQGDCIMLQKYEAGCIFCGSTQNLTTHMGKPVCARCREDLAE